MEMPINMASNGCDNQKYFYRQLAEYQAGAAKNRKPRDAR